MLSIWWSKLNTLVTLKLGPAHTLGIVMIFLWTLSPYIYAKLDTIRRRQKCQPGGMGSKGVNPPELTKFDALKLDMAEKQFNSISSLSHATICKTTNSWLVGGVSSFSQVDPIKYVFYASLKTQANFWHGLNHDGELKYGWNERWEKVDAEEGLK